MSAGRRLKSLTHDDRRWLLVYSLSITHILNFWNVFHVLEVAKNTACYASAVYPRAIRPSVRMSVKRVNCDKIKAPSEKNSIMTNRKSTTSFPMGLRRTAYVTPISSPKNGNWPFFPLKVYFSQTKSATKFVCVKTFSGTVVRHSLPYLAVHKWLVGDVPFYLKFWTKVTHHLQKRRFPTYIRS